MEAKVASEFGPRVLPPNAITQTRGFPRFLPFVAGWLWRVAVGTVLTFNVFILSYFTSLAVAGWLQRWMQGRVLRGWWKQSRFRQEGTFDDFCGSLGAQAPSARPRWFLQERGSYGRLTWPWHSFWLNLKRGVQVVFCTYLFTGFGCLLMLMSWEFGWLNSFHKGYEQAWVGPLTGFFGSILFILAMFYVPMAQAHQAAVGEARAFFHFRFIWQLVRARPTAYFGLACLYLLVSVVIEIFRVFLVSEDFPANAKDLTAAEALAELRQYLAGMSLGLFLVLLLLRGMAARIYGAAVLKALRLGAIARAELPPLLAGWLDKLEMMPVPAAPGSLLVEAVKGTSRWSYRRVLFAAIFVVWLVYLARLYSGYFLVAHPYLLFLNHPLVQLPCVDYTPLDLVTAAGN